MISLLLKHKILEFSIDQFFKTIESNFKNTPDRVVGDKFKHITVYPYDRGDDINRKTCYDRCEIVDMYSDIYLGIKMTIFKFTTGNGDHIMACSKDDIIFDR